MGRGARQAVAPRSRASLWLRLRPEDFPVVPTTCADASQRCSRCVRLSCASFVGVIVQRSVWAVPMMLGTCAAVVVTAGAANGRPRASAMPVLRSNGIGSLHFGAPRRAVLAALQPSLGRPNAAGINTGCGKDLSEVAWHDLIAEFRNGRLSGYRFILGGWPLTTPGSPRDHVSSTAPTTLLRTQAGITLGATSGQLHSAYPALERTGAVRWTARDGLTFTEPSTVMKPTSRANTIIEIQTGTCGDF
jgi:hypothetical protein